MFSFGLLENDKLTADGKVALAMFTCVEFDCYWKKADGYAGVFCVR